MAILQVPHPDHVAGYPTLGDQLLDFYRREIPSIILTPEQQAFVRTFYSLYPLGHEHAGQRRFDRCALELRKGLGKTTLAAVIAFGEIHPWAPARFNGFKPDGQLHPGRPVRQPYIPMLAASQEQVGDLAYSMVRRIVAESHTAHLFLVSQERITRIGEGGVTDGLLQPVSNLAAVRDGVSTTFQHLDEPHRMANPGQRACVETMMAGIATKRADETPWTLSTSTAGSPAEQSVQADLRREAEELADGRTDSERSRYFFYSRWAAGDYDLNDYDQRLAALTEAQGDAGAQGIDHLERTARDWDRAGCDHGTWERLQLNRYRHSDAGAYPVEKVRALLRPDERISEGAFVTVGFDGARNRDSTAIVTTCITTGMQQLFAIWERPDDADDSWTVPVQEVDEAMTYLFDRFDVWRAYCDPPYWTEQLAIWAGRWPGRIVEFETRALTKATNLARVYGEAIDAAQIAFVGPHTSIMFRHICNAGRRQLHGTDENGENLWCLQKLDGQDRNKFDACMAGTLSWKGRLMAIAGNAYPGGCGATARRLY